MNNQDIEIIRGNDETVEIKLLGDFTSETAYFTIKEKNDLIGIRYVDLSTGSGVVATYSAPYTTFAMTIPKANTSGLTFHEMVWDLWFNENTTKVKGDVKLIHVARSVTDGTVIPDTFATSSIIVQRPTASGVSLFNVSAIEDVYDNTLSGDLVIVKSSQDAGDNIVQFKDGVNWDFKGFPTINGDSVSGTFGDSNSAVNVHITGDVNITNSNGLASRIIMQNASSNLNGFHWIYNAKIVAGAGLNMISTILKNTLGGVPAWTRGSAGIWTLTLVGAFAGSVVASPEYLVHKLFYSIGVGMQLLTLGTTTNDDDSLTVRSESFSTTSTDDKAPYDSGTTIKDYTIKVYP